MARFREIPRVIASKEVEDSLRRLRTGYIDIYQSPHIQPPIAHVPCAIRETFISVPEITVYSI